MSTALPWFGPGSLPGRVAMRAGSGSRWQLNALGHTPELLVRPVLHHRGPR